jgi:glycosyltransferase involved in cell wall biosynthesis
VASSPIFVTIIVPTYNRHEMLKRALASIQRQTHQHFEVIVIDNGSSDRTWGFLEEYASQFPNTQVFRIEKNSGSPMACYNKGLDLARGDYIGIMYDDDELIPDALEFLCGKAVATEHPWIVGNCIDDATKAFAFRGVTNDCVISFNDIATGRYSGEAWSIFSRALIGGLRFDSQMYGGESSVWLQLYRKSSALYFHRAVRVYYTQHGGNLTGLKKIIENIDKLIYTESQYIRLFHREFENLGILRDKFYRIALMNVLAGRRLESTKVIKNYLSRKHLPHCVFHLLLLMLPTRMVAAGVVWRRSLLDAIQTSKASRTTPKVVT